MDGCSESTILSQQATSFDKALTLHSSSFHARGWELLSQEHGMGRTVLRTNGLGR